MVPLKRAAATLARLFFVPSAERASWRAPGTTRGNLPWLGTLASFLSGSGVRQVLCLLALCSPKSFLRF